MMRAMKPILSEAAASAVVVIDEAGGATLSEVARASGKAISTVQRAVDALVGMGAIRRISPRGALVFRPDAPKGALRELADWTLGPRRVQVLAGAIASREPDTNDMTPRTIKDPEIRRAWPGAIRSIVDAYDPARVILFGSQARGDAALDSDVDLLVVFDEQVDRRERQVEIQRLLRGAPFAKDVLVASTSDLFNAARGTAIAEAFHDGLVVYER